ncbi:MAG TPA: hypothetical protein VMT16_03295 [Thermoanaerobaculia bacterium]|nr:hypothetical protein [Thermoanaerobaculia bacterium]
MAGSEHEVRLAPGALRHWLEMEDREAREEAHEILEALRRRGTAPRTYSLLNGPEHRAYGRRVKVLFHRDDPRRLVSVTDILPR